MVQRMSWRKWMEMKNEAKPTVIDAVLGLLNFNPEGNIGHTQKF